MQSIILKYRSGEEIKKGDHVLFHGNPAQVELVASDPNDPEAAWHIKEYGGGVSVLDPMVSGRTFIPKDQLADYEDLEFVSRAVEQELPAPPPIIMVNDRVLLHYAVLNDSVGFNSGHGLMFVDGKEIGKVPRLAICQDKESPQLMLYYCNSDWTPIGIASYDTVDAAKRRAERIYPKSLACWVQAQFTEADAERFREENFSDMQCSFCGKRPDENLSATFVGEGNARICGDCVREFHDDLNKRSS